MTVVCGPVSDVLKILTVCTHNRTRSVMSMAMLQRMLDERVGSGRAMVRSLGFGPEGLPAIPDAVDAMARRGLDVSGHLSRQVRADRVDQADLVLTAEKDHVIGIAAQSPDAARRAFTLPEFIDLVADTPAPPGVSLADWAADLSRKREPAAYLADLVPEVADPTGSPRRRFEAATVEIEALCVRAADAVAAVAAAT